MVFNTLIFDRAAEDVRLYIHFASPVILLAFFLVVFTAHSIATASPDSTVAASTQLTGPGGKPLPQGKGASQAKAQQMGQVLDFSPARKLLFDWASAGAVLTFVANAVIVISHALWNREDNWWCGQHVAVCSVVRILHIRLADDHVLQIYVVASFFVYSLFLISLVDTKPSPTIAHCLTWLVALTLEAMLLGSSFAVYIPEHREPSTDDPSRGKIRSGLTRWEAVELAVDVLRLILLLALVSFYFLFVYLRGRDWQRTHREDRETSGESTALLNGHQRANGSANGHVYGSVPAGEEQSEGWSRPTKVPSKSWWEYIRGYSLFFPYLWPAKSLRLQITVVVCIIVVVLQRIVNVLVPNQAGSITNVLAGGDGEEPGIPWGGICLYIFYRLLQGNNGLLGALRSTLWIPISQYSYQELSTAAFEHVHGLSLDFHLGKKTGEVLSALSKGNSINTFLEQVTFQVFPMLVDLAVAIGYFLYKFDAYYALIVTIVTFTYLYLTIRLAQWRAEIRREMVNFSRQEDAVKYVLSIMQCGYLSNSQQERFDGLLRDREIFQRRAVRVCSISGSGTRLSKSRVQGTDLVKRYERFSKCRLYAWTPDHLFHCRLPGHIRSTESGTICDTTYLYAAAPNPSQLLWHFLSLYTVRHDKFGADARAFQRAIHGF